MQNFGQIFLKEQFCFTKMIPCKSWPFQMVFTDLLKQIFCSKYDLYNRLFVRQILIKVNRYLFIFTKVTTSMEHFVPTQHLIFKCYKSSGKLNASIPVYKSDINVHSDFWSSQLIAAVTNVLKLLHDSPSFTCKLAMSLN